MQDVIKHACRMTWAALAAVTAVLLLTLGALLFVPPQAYAATAGDTAQVDIPLTTSGGVQTTVSCRFKILDADAQTVQLGYDNSSGSSSTKAVDISTAGELTIPEKVSIDGKDYTVVTIGNFAFGNGYTNNAPVTTKVCTGLTKVTVPESVTSIGNYAFGCLVNATVNVPGKVSTLGAGAYIGTAVSGTVALMEGAKSVGTQVFRDCKGITKVVYGENIATIGNNVFQGCSGVTEVDYPKSYTSLPVGFLYGMEKITDVSQWLTGDWTTIGNYAFAGTGVTSATLSPTGANGEALTWGTNVFASCTSLTSAKVESGFAALPASSFLSCSSLTALDLPDEYVDIPASFVSGTGLTSVDFLMRDGGTVGNSAFANCANVTSVTVNPKLVSMGSGVFMGTGITTVELPSTVKYLSTTSMFRACPNLESIVLPEGITEIGTYCFFRSPNLRSVTLPSTVTSIADYAFSECSRLSNVVLNEGLSSIGSNAFQSCSGLTSIDLPSTVTTINNRAFAGCSSIQTVELPKSLTSMSNAFSWLVNSTTGEFEWCKSLTSVTFAEGCTFGDLDSNFAYAPIASIAFPEGVTKCSATYLYSLESVSIPASCTTLGSFSGVSPSTYYVGDTTSHLKTVTFAAGSKLASIQSFQGCSSLESINIPDSVTVIGNKAFADCAALRNVGFGAFSQLNGLGNFVFQNCTSLESISLPDSLTYIPQSCFTGCIGLKSVQFSTGLTDVYAGAFSGCTSLSSVSFPASTVTVGAQALSGCTSLTGVKFAADEVNLTNSAAAQFAGDGSLEKVTVGTTVYYPVKYWRTDARQKLLGVMLLKEGSTLADAKASTGLEVPAVVLDGSVISAPYQSAGWTYEGVGEAQGITASAASAYAYLDSEAPAAAADVDAVFSDDSVEGVPVTYRVISNGSDGEQPRVQVGAGNNAAGVAVLTNNTGRAVPYDATAVTIPGQVTFEDVSYLVTRVGEYAFYGAANLATLNLPDTVVEISNGVHIADSTQADSRAGLSYAFTGCTSLNSLTIPASVERIGSNAGLGGVEDLVFAEGSRLTDLGSKVFNLGTLQSVVFPDSLNFYGNEIFNGCPELRDVTIGAACTTGSYFNTASNSNGGIYLDNIYWRSYKKNHQENYPTAHPTGDWGEAKYPELVRATRWYSVWYYADQQTAVNDCIDGSTHSLALGQVYVKENTSVTDASVAAGTMEGTSMGLVKEGTSWTYDSGSSAYADIVLTDATPLVDTVYAYGAIAATVSGIEDSYASTGAAIQPKPVVTDPDGKVLVEGTDYELSYGVNTASGADAGSVTVTGKGGWTGSVTVSFDIVDGVEGFAVSGLEDSYTFTGNPLSPGITVSEGDAKLTDEADALHMSDASYQVRYSDNVNVGTASVTVTGLNAYSGTKTATFDIEQMPLTGTSISVADIPTQEWTGSVVKPSVTVTNSNITDSLGKVLAEGKDYTVVYLDDKGNVADPVDPGSYVARIEGVGNYSGTVDEPFFIGQDISEATIAAVPDATWSGAAEYPAPEVKLGNEVLVAGTDFTYVYTGCDKVGAATVGVKGINGYAGTADSTVAFAIAAADLADGRSTHNGEVAAVYNGQAANPSFNVIYNGHAVVAGVDYDVTYKDADGATVSAPVAAGSYTVTLTGKGNYTGSLASTLTLAEATLADADVTGIEKSYSYTGQPIAIVPSVMLGSGELALGVDYTVTFEDADDNKVSEIRDPGSYTVTIDGAGDVQGSRSFDVAVVRNSTSQWTRLAGATGLDTMVDVAQEGWAEGSCTTVIVAPADDWHDALAASGLAGILECPVLTTSSSGLSAQTSAEIQRLGATKVYVVGGPYWISDDIKSAIAGISGVTSVERISGETGADTAVAVYEKGAEIGTWGSTAIVATDGTYHDALAAAPLAYAKRYPVLLSSSGTATLGDATLSAIQAGGFASAVIAGGPYWTSDDALAQLDGIGVSASRVAGADAYETSVKLAEKGLSEGLSANRMGVATGGDYHDALAGAALCGKNASVLVLASEDNETAIVGFVTPHKVAIEQGYLYGGEFWLSKELYADLVIATSSS